MKAIDEEIQEITHKLTIMADHNLRRLNFGLPVFPAPTDATKIKEFYVGILQADRVKLCDQFEAVMMEGKTE